jgi:putative transposase
MPWKETQKMDQKIEFAMKAVNTESFSELCREYGISRKTGYKWRERFVSEGVAGMQEESRRPQSHAAELGEEVVCRIVRLKEAHRHWGARKIRELYRLKYAGELPSESSFKRVLERAGLTEKRHRQSREQSGRLEAGVEVLAPNDLWTVDFKGWWRGGEGKRIEPLTVRDAHSRFILEMQIVENAKSETVGARFEHLFKAHGLPGAIRSDNGTPFACAHSLLGLTRLSAWWLALGIDLVRGRPGCPQDNGGHERMHLDIFRELERGRACADQASFDLWRHEFNTERPHEAIGMARPAEVYCPSTRVFKGTPQAIDYGAMDTRTVSKNGTIGYARDYFQISTALQGWNVGLSPTDNGLIEVWLGKLLVGHMDPKTAAFRPTTPPKKSKSRSKDVSFWPSSLRSEDKKDTSLTPQPKPKKL